MAGMDKMYDDAVQEIIFYRLRDAGLRPTTQRVQLGCLIWGGEGDRHVSADMLLRQSRIHGINVSLATIYNTLHQFTRAGLLREIAVDGGSAYFDTKLTPHHHFMFEDSGEIMDIDENYVNISNLPLPPVGTSISDVQLVIKLQRAIS